MKLDPFNTASTQERQAYFLPKDIGLGVGQSQQIGMTMKGCLWGECGGGAKPLNTIKILS